MDGNKAKITLINLQDYIISSRLFKTWKVDDLLFVQYTCLIDDDTSDIWTHNNYFAYVLGGRKKWKTRQGEYLFDSGDCLFVKKGAHTVYQYFEEEFHVFFVFLSDDFIAKTLTKYSYLNLNTKRNGDWRDDSVIPIPSTPVMSSYFQSLLSYLPQEVPPDPNLLKIKIEELILNVFSQPGNESLKKYLSTRKYQQQIDIEEVMESQFSNLLSINDFARLSARSLSSFRRDFKSIYQTTPGKWLMKRRLDYACLLLKNTSCTISEIANQCGFKNQSHFIKVFKFNFEVSPRNFRKVHNSSN